MSEPEKSEPKSPSLTEMVAVLPRKIFTREAALWLTAILLGSVAFGQGMARLDGGVEKQLAPLAARVEAVEQRQATDAKATAQKLEQLSSDNHETQLDVRELYRVIRSGRPSERLEAPPVTDGGR